MSGANNIRLVKSGDGWLATWQFKGQTVTGEAETRRYAARNVLEKVDEIEEDR